MNQKLSQDYFIWKRFKEGDEEAFFYLYDQYVDVLYSFGCQYFKDHEVVKDYIHDTFLDLYKYREKLSDTNNIRFYLFCTFRHKIQRELGKNKAISYTDEIQSLNDDITSSYEDNLIASETKKEKLELLQEALSRLPKKQRETILLKFSYNLSYPEIAKILNISVESVRTGIYRALKEIRKWVSSKGYPITLLFILLGHADITSCVKMDSKKR